MLASARCWRPTFSRQQSYRTTRRTQPASTGLHPVSSHSGQDIPELSLGARLDLPHALAREMQPVADFLQRARLVVFQAEAEPHHLALLAVEIVQRAGELVEIRLMNHRIVDRRDVLLHQHVAAFPPTLVSAA